MVQTQASRCKRKFFLTCTVCHIRMRGPLDYGERTTGGERQAEWGQRGLSRTGRRAGDAAVEEAAVEEEAVEEEAIVTIVAAERKRVTGRAA